MKEVEMFKMAFWSANVLEAEVGTNTPKGGDAGHGGETVFILRSPKENTSWEAEIKDENNKTTKIVGPQEITIRLFGDTEATTFIEALKFALYILETQNSRNVAISKS